MACTVACTVLWLAACAGDPAVPPPSGAPVSELRIGMHEYAYQLSAGALAPGTVTVVVTNAGSAGHDVVLVQDGTAVGGSDVLPPGGRQTFTVEVAPGIPVDLECTVGGHRAAGMHTRVAVGER